MEKDAYKMKKTALGGLIMSKAVYVKLVVILRVLKSHQTFFIYI